MLNIGVMTSSGLENFFIEEEISRTSTERIGFVGLKSILECGDFMKTCKIDAYITTLSGHEQTLEEDDNIDWFAFSWYEDYPYNVLYINGSSESQSVIVPPFIRCADLLPGEKKPLPFRGKVEKAIHELTHGGVKGLLVPGRVANYLEERFSQLKEYRETRLPVYEKKVTQAEFVMLFRRENKQLEELKRHFVKSVRFVGGGAGDFTMCTTAGVEELKHAQVCLHDSLIDQKLLNYLPANALVINAGKRHFKHSLEQPEINKLLVKYARLGFRVVRLKCGDPSIFGRLAEEIDYIEKHNIPYKVIPGTSSLNVLSTTGIVPTRRGINRGFCVMSPIKHGGSFASVGAKERTKLPMVFFMGVRVVNKIANELINEGMPADTETAVAFSLGTPDEKVIRGTLADIGEKISSVETEGHLPPGLFIVGKISGFIFKNNPLLEEHRILIAGKGSKANKLAARFEDFGAKTEIFKPPEIETAYLFNAIQRSRQYELIVFSERHLMHKFIHLSNEYGIETAPYKLITETNNIDNAETKEKLMGKTLLYIYTRKNHELFKLLRRIAKMDEAHCPTRALKGKMGPFTDAVFLDDESLISFVEAGFLENIKGASVWADLDEHSKEILKRKGIKVNAIPHDSPLTTDIRFILETGENLQGKKVAI